MKLDVIHRNLRKSQGVRFKMIGILHIQSPHGVREAPDCSGASLYGASVFCNSKPPENEKGHQAGVPFLKGPGGLVVALCQDLLWE